MLACISKNDRADALFERVAALAPGTVRLGRVTPSVRTKLIGTLLSLSPSVSQIRADMQFSPVLARAGQRLTEEKLRSVQDVTHVLQWGAMYTPVRDTRRLAYSIVTDGPFDPEDARYPVEWKPRRWASEYFERQRNIYREATLVFTLSEWARQKVIALHGLDPKRVVRIGWGPMFEAKPVARVESSKVFVSIGNEWQRKGMDLVARVGAMLHVEDSQVKTMIAGDPAGMRIAAREGVTLLPRKLAVEEVKMLLGGARGLVVASRFDASPHIVMEALQMGVPVIASEVCGISEGVQPPLGGIMVPVGDEEALLNAMRRMLRGEQEMQRTEALSAYAATGGWEAVAWQVVNALVASGVLQRAIA